MKWLRYNETDFEQTKESYFYKGFAAGFFKHCSKNTVVINKACREKINQLQ